MGKEYRAKSFKSGNSVAIRMPAALEAACRRHGAQVLCLTTEAQNPTTGRMPIQRRQEIA